MYRDKVFLWMRVEVWGFRLPVFHKPICNTGNTSIFCLFVCFFEVENKFSDTWKGKLGKEYFWIFKISFQFLTVVLPIPNLEQFFLATLLSNLSKVFIYDFHTNNSVLSLKIPLSSVHVMLN